MLGGVPAQRDLHPGEDLRVGDLFAVRPGENVWIDVDVLMTHDVCGPGTIGVFKAHFGGDKAKVWDKEKVVVIPDHYIFTADATPATDLDERDALLARGGTVRAGRGRRRPRSRGSPTMAARARPPMCTDQNEAKATPGR